jgi:4-hydroxy-tetrahydrodipicolinate reductase
MNQRMISIIIVGARGRMGTTLIREVLDSEDLTLGACVDRSGGPGIGQDAGRLAGRTDLGILVTDELRPRRGSVVVDFSLPKATETNVNACIEAGIPLIIGTTGLDEQQEQQLAGTAAAALGPDWEAELIELHHRFKRDAPSGTALRIGQAIAEATDRKFSDVAITDRSSLGRPRQPQEIGVYGMRGGDSIGEHTLMFLGEGERIELVHRATDRAIFARGALRAARWVVSQPPGLYDMFDVLGLGE